MERRRRESLRRGTLLATATALAAVIALPQLAGANDLGSRVILIADSSRGALERIPNQGANKEKPRETIQPPEPAGVVPPPSAAPVWVPRIRRGAPASRVGGATRGGDKVVTIQTLVPEVDEAALTLAAQPELYWYLSADTTHPVNFTLIDPNAIDPIVDSMITGPFSAGVHVLSLADYDARLESGRNYEWYVAVVPDSENRSVDTVARGAIVRVAEPELASQIAASEPDAAVVLLAQSGIWYDALDAASRRMQETPEDPQSRQWRDAMLQQVGLALSDNR